MREYATPAAFRAAVEARLRERARVSIDLDADHLHGAEAARDDLQRAAIKDVGDHFGFAVVGSEELREAGVGLLIRQYEPVDVSRLREAVRRTFDQRATHPVPERLPPPHAALAVAYRREARRVSTVAGLEEAHQLLAQWLDPVFAEIRHRG